VGVRLNPGGPALADSWNQEASGVAILSIAIAEFRDHVVLFALRLHRDRNHNHNPR